MKSEKKEQPDQKGANQEKKNKYEATKLLP